MSDESSILIVDENAAFATLLQEGLEQGGEYHTTVATSGDKALQLLAESEFDLVVVDLGLTDPEGTTFVRSLREQQPDLRLVLIPLTGEELPPELANLDVQGILPKPFFFPELPGHIADALARNVGEGPSAEKPLAATEPSPNAEPPTAAEPPGVSETAALDAASADRLAEVRDNISAKRMQRIVQAMGRLAQDISAEAVIQSITAPAAGSRM